MAALTRRKVPSARRDPTSKRVRGKVSAAFSQLLCDDAIVLGVPVGEVLEAYRQLAADHAKEWGLSLRAAVGRRIQQARAAA